MHLHLSADHPPTSENRSLEVMTRTQSTGYRRRVSRLRVAAAAAACLVAASALHAAAPGSGATLAPPQNDLGFHSVDGNIGCWIQRDTDLYPELSARCMPRARAWVPRWRDCRDISNIEYFSVSPTARRGRHEYTCTGGVPWYLPTRTPWQARVLRPGQSVSWGDLTCQAMSTSQIRCQNRLRHGFSVSRQRFRLF